MSKDAQQKKASRSSSPEAELTIELLQRAKDGDESAWVSINQRHRDALYTLAHGKVRGQLRGRLDTEDLVQSTLLAAFKGLDGYVDHGQGSFQAWLMKILSNRINQRLRHHLSDKRAVHQQVGLEAADFVKDLSTMSPTDALLAAESQALLIDAVSELSDSDAQILIRNQLEGTPVQALATELEMSESSIRRRRAAAIATLTKKLE